MPRRCAVVYSASGRHEEEIELIEHLPHGAGRPSGARSTPLLATVIASCSSRHRVNPAGPATATSAAGPSRAGRRHARAEEEICSERNSAISESFACVVVERNFLRQETRALTSTTHAKLPVRDVSTAAGRARV